MRQAGRASFALATGLADMQITQADLVGYMSYGGHTSPWQARGVRLCCLDSSFICLNELRVVLFFPRCIPCATSLSWDACGDFGLNVMKLLSQLMNPSGAGSCVYYRQIVNTLPRPGSLS